MARPRRAMKIKKTMWPGWLRKTAFLLVAGLIAAVIAYAYRIPAAAEMRTVETIVYRDWPVYIDQMPQQCIDMLEDARKLYGTSASSDLATLKAARLATEGIKDNSTSKLQAASKAAEEAEEWGPKLKKARERFTKQYEECADA